MHYFPSTESIASRARTPFSGSGKNSLRARTSDPLTDSTSGDDDAANRRRHQTSAENAGNVDRRSSKRRRNGIDETGEEERPDSDADRRKDAEKQQQQQQQRQRRRWCVSADDGGTFEQWRRGFGAGRKALARGRGGKKENRREFWHSKTGAHIFR